MVKVEKLDVIKKQKYELAADLRDRERKILTKLEEEKKKFEDQLQQSKREISEELVYEVVSNMTKIPVNKITIDETKTLVKLEETLNNIVIGQEDAVKKMVSGL